jgi:hypothetical protein
MGFFVMRLLSLPFWCHRAIFDKGNHKDQYRPCVGLKLDIDSSLYASKIKVATTTDQPRLRETERYCKMYDTPS